ncbi:hypothetical protein OS189_17165 [Sulfitobacter sp. F26169L]|uniref:hypothetical protein n=1 Tax=Sulfitobacter sp. F26169L TaxID=2996015 RepID=UPI002260E3DF|nr:hypothetical protein [Sulfitobacter sp. F26169L]MCX7568075.1 hypothetical protein [Sulfitobacter sp. F26169L]
MTDLSTDAPCKDFPLMTPKAWLAALFFDRYPEVPPHDRCAANILGSDTFNYALSTISSGKTFAGFGSAEVARIQQLSNAERSCVALVGDRFWTGGRNKEPDLLQILCDVSGRAPCCVFSQDQILEPSK